MHNDITKLINLLKDPNNERYTNDSVDQIFSNALNYFKASREGLFERTGERTDDIFDTNKLNIVMYGLMCSNKKYWDRLSIIINAVKIPYYLKAEFIDNNKNYLLKHHNNLSKDQRNTIKQRSDFIIHTMLQYHSLYNSMLRHVSMGIDQTSSNILSFMSFNDLMGVIAYHVTSHDPSSESLFVTPVIQQDLKVIGIDSKNFTIVRMSNVWRQYRTLIDSDPENDQVKGSLNKIIQHQDHQNNISDKTIASIIVNHIYTERECQIASVYNYDLGDPEPKKDQEKIYMDSFMVLVYELYKTYQTNQSQPTPGSIRKLNIIFQALDMLMDENQVNFSKYEANRIFGQKDSLTDKPVAMNAFSYAILSGNIRLASFIFDNVRMGPENKPICAIDTNHTIYPDDILIWRKVVLYGDDKDFNTIREMGFDILERDRYGDIISQAILHNKPDVVERCFDYLKSKSENALEDYMSHSRRVDGDISYESYYGAEYLLYACQMGYHNIAEILINAGVDVNATPDFSNEHFEYALPYITYRDDVDFISINRINRIYSTASALGIAAKRADLPLFEILINSGADVNFVNNNGDTVIHYATQEDPSESIIKKENKYYRLNDDSRIKIVKTLIDKDIDINVKNRSSTTPLENAIGSYQEDIAIMLLETGGRTFNNPAYVETDGLVDQTTNVGMVSAVLFLAAFSGCNKLTNWIAENYKNLYDLKQTDLDQIINNVDCYDRNILFYTKSRSNRFISKAITDQHDHISTIVDLPDNPTHTDNIHVNELDFVKPLDLHSNHEMLQLMKELGIDKNKRDRWGDTALCRAHRNHDLFIQHIELGLDKSNLADNLRLEIIYRSLNTITSLLARSSNINSYITNRADAVGLTPLYYAFNFPQEHIAHLYNIDRYIEDSSHMVNLLLHKGANPNQTITRTDTFNTEVFTALTHAESCLELNYLTDQQRDKIRDIIGQMRYFDDSPKPGVNP